MKKISQFIEKNLFFSISFLILIIVIIIILVSYMPHKSKEINDYVEEEEIEEGLKEEGEFARYIKQNDFICDALEDKIYIGDKKSFISYDGVHYKYYLYNISKKFENEQNCLLIFETDKKIIGYNHYIDGGIIYEDGIVYDDFTYDRVRNRQLETIGKKVMNDQSLYTLRSNYHLIYYYELTNLIGGNQSSSLLVEPQAIYYEITRQPYKLLDVFEGYNIERVYPYSVLSETSVFTYGITNHDCEEYVDRKCKYGFYLNEDLSDYIDDIAFMNQDYIIFKDGTVYLYQKY